MADTVLLYGELCGGGYPHPDVEPNPLVDLVQTGVYYSPNIELCVFDIAVQKNDTLQPKIYLDYTVLSDFCQKAGLLYTEALFEGSYEDALRTDIHFESKLPDKLSLPKLPFPNKAEGVVIKPRQNLYLTTEKETFRPMLKQKIAAFSEVQFHQSEKWDAFAPKGKMTRLLRDLLQLVNRNRLTNAASKIGKIKPDDAAKIAQLRLYFYEDIQDEIRKSFAKEFPKLTQCEKETVERQLQAAMEEAVAAYVSGW